MARKPAAPLKRGWTTGACATAATRAAYCALLTGEFPDPVTIRLPKGHAPAFALARERLGPGYALAGIVKDAGDDPDVTHGALVISTVRRAAAGSGVTFRAGEGVGTVEKRGLALAVGEPAINPAPRKLMRAEVAAIAAAEGDGGDVEIEISIPGGAALAARTWNPRLGIAGGLSILGTTGIVIPYSCSAWIASIRQGVDVARANGHDHIAGCTGKTSERAVQRRLGLADIAMIDMGDFAGGLLKYLRTHPVAHLTIGGGFAKISKLAAGHLDLHSGRSQVDFGDLAAVAGAAGSDAEIVARIGAANSAGAVLDIAQAAGLPLADTLAARARDTALEIVGDKVAVDIMIVDRNGRIVGAADG